MYIAMQDEEVNMLELSTFLHGELKAEVFKKDNSYGCRFYDSVCDKIFFVLYSFHNEHCAEYASEYYVFCINKVVL